MVQQAKKKNQTIQHILHNKQSKKHREMDKGMDNLKLTVSQKVNVI